MKHTTKKLPKAQFAIEVELTAEELEQKRAQALSALSKQLRLEGFRPGHVPPEVAEKHIQENVLLQETAQLAIESAYRDILQQEELDVIGEPEVHITKLAFGNPLEFRIQVAVLPDVELADYKKIAETTERKEVKVEEKDVDEALEWLRKSRKADTADNEFAKSIGNFPDLASLRTSIEEGLKQEKEMQERDRLRQAIVEAIAKESKLDVPDVLVEREKKVLLSQVQQGVNQMLQMSFEDYKKKTGKTEEELLDSFGEEAEQRVRRFLVVREIAKREKVNPTEEEIERETQAILQHYANADQAKESLDPERLKEYTEGVLRHEKTLQLLENFVKA